jgi:hypothetical protein
MTGEHEDKCAAGKNTNPPGRFTVTIRMLECQDQQNAETSRVSRSDEIAHAIYDQAMASARSQARADQQVTEFGELAPVPGFVGHFLRDLTVGVAQALAANDPRVLAVYSYEALPEPGAEAENLSGALVHLLVLVTAPSAALEAFVASLNRALGARLRASSGAWFSRTGLLLDINVVTELEVRQGVGVARLLSAVLPPVRLWQRKE